MRNGKRPAAIADAVERLGDYGVQLRSVCRSRLAEGEQRASAFAAAAHVEPKRAIIIGRFGGTDGPSRNRWNE
jgi:hypothetical protein